MLETVVVVWERIEQTLDRALGFIGRCDEVYRRGGPRVRHLANQALFEKLLVHDDEVGGAILREPWATPAADDLLKPTEDHTPKPDPFFCWPGFEN